MPPRIQYQTSDGLDVNIDFDGQDFNVIESENVVNNDVSTSQSGVEQQATYYDVDTLRVQRRLAEGNLARQLNEFWQDHARDGNSFEFWLDYEMGGYWPFEKRLRNTDGVDGTFTRTDVANSANYLDPSTGLYQEADGANIPRFPAGKYGRGVLIEGSRVNYITRSETFGTTWTSGGDVTVSSNTTETKDPFGGTAADKLTADINNAQISFSTGESVTSTDGCFSVFLKTAVGTVACDLILSGTSSGTKTQAITVTSEWQRFSVTYDDGVDSALTGNFDCIIDINTNTEFVYAFGGQFEKALFPSGYIKADGGSTVTRNAEVLYYTVSETQINPNYGTIAFWFKPEWIYNKHSNACLFWINSTNSANRVLSLFVLSGGTFEWRHYDGGGTVRGSVTPSASALTQNEWNHLCVVWDSTLSNGSKLYVNGSQVGSASSNSAFSSADVENTMYLGIDTGTAQCFGVIDDFVIWKRVLDSYEVNQLYNKGRSHGMQRNYWSAMKMSQNVFNPVQRKGQYYDLDLQMKEVISA